MSSSLTPVVALELEFYLLDDDESAAQTAPHEDSGNELDA